MVHVAPKGIAETYRGLEKDARPLVARAKRPLPPLVFRQTYDALVGFDDARADIEHVRVLKLAAETMATDVEHALRRLLESAQQRPGFNAGRSRPR